MRSHAGGFVVSPQNLVSDCLSTLARGLCNSKFKIAVLASILSLYWIQIKVSEALLLSSILISQPLLI